MAEKIEPLQVRVSKSKGIQVQWADGHLSTYDHAYLRDHCPCATCREAEPGGQSALPLYRPNPQVVAAEVVGNYAIHFRFSDGHQTGIYSYVYLRSICPCAECQRQRGESAPESQP